MTSTENTSKRFEDAIYTEVRNLNGRYHKYGLREKVRVVDTGQEVTIQDRFFISNMSIGVPQYQVDEQPATWFSESELEAL